MHGLKSIVKHKTREGRHLGPGDLGDRDGGQVRPVVVRAPHAGAFHDPPGWVPSARQVKLRRDRVNRGQ